MRSARFVALAATLAVASSWAGVARAQYFDDQFREQERVSTPELVAVELKGGPYAPSPGNGFDRFYGDDSGPLLAVEVDALILRIPYVGHVGAGLGFGWANLSGDAPTQDGGTSSEENTLKLFPMSALGILRVDVLAREVGIPLTFAGKLGADFVFWNETKGETDTGSGIGLGFRWGIQAALELDFFEPRAARRLDEEWGINHTFLLFEYFGSTAEDDFDLGDRTWALGLGFIL